MISILIELAISLSIFLINMSNRYLFYPKLIFSTLFLRRIEEQHENSHVGQLYGYCHSILQQLIESKVNAFYIFYIINFKFIFSCRNYVQLTAFMI